MLEKEPDLSDSALEPDLSREKGGGQGTADSPKRDCKDGGSPHPSEIDKAGPNRPICGGSDWPAQQSGPGALTRQAPLVNSH